MKIYLIIGVILILIFLYWLLFKIKTISIPPKTYLCFNDIKDKLKTGDIIFFSSNSFKGIVRHVFYRIRTNYRYNTIWGHIGLVYRDDHGKLYLMEFNVNKNGKNAGRMVELESDLKRYQTRYNAIFGVRRISHSLDNNKLLKVYNQINNYGFRADWKVVFLHVLPELCHQYIATEQDREMYCSEFISYLLYKLGVIKKNKKHYHYAPNHFLEDHDKNNLTENYSYSPIETFIV